MTPSEQVQVYTRIEVSCKVTPGQRTGISRHQVSGQVWVYKGKRSGTSWHQVSERKTGGGIIDFAFHYCVTLWEDLLKEITNRTCFRPVHCPGGSCCDQRHTPPLPLLPLPLPYKMKLFRQVGHYLRGAHSRLSSERHSINASYPSPCCTLTRSPGDPGERGRGIAFYPKAWRSWKTAIVLGRVFGVWLSGAITAMALEQVGDSPGPAHTGININVNRTPKVELSHF